MKNNFVIVTLIAVFVLLFSFAYAEETPIYKGISEAVMTLENGNGALFGHETAPVPANSTIRVQLDGTYLDFTDSEGNVVNPQILSDRTMVPMRKIFETFSANVGWDESTRTVTATTDTKEITLTIDNNVATLKDLATGAVSSINLDQAPVIVDGRTLVPVRFIAESLNKEVGWDNEARTVIIIDMAKLTKLLSSRVTALQKLFDMNIEPVSSFKSSSVLSGNIEYTEAGEAQNLSISGNAKVAVNKQEDMESELNLNISGKEGNLVEAVKNSGYENVNAKVILKGDQLFVGILDGNDYMWTDASSSMSSINNVSIAYNIDKITNYESVMAFIRSTLGELNQDSYNTMTSMINALSLVLSEKSVNLVENNGTKTLTIDLNFGDFIKQFASTERDIGLEFNVVLTAKDGKIESEKINIKGDFDLSGEDLKLDITIDSKYEDLNNDFEVKVPTV